MSTVLIHEEILSTYDGVHGLSSLFILCACKFEVQRVKQSLNFVQEFSPLCFPLDEFNVLRRVGPLISQNHEY